jgi:hypothetical protein
MGLKESMQKLDKALVQKDELVLQKILHNNVSYGHSSGWVQNKTDVLNDFKNGKLIYNKLESSNPVILAINKDWATVRMDTKAEGLLNGNAFNLSMYIMQVWMKTKVGWQLFARQSAKQ